MLLKSIEIKNFFIFQVGLGTKFHEGVLVTEESVNRHRQIDKHSRYIDIIKVR